MKPLILAGAFILSALIWLYYAATIPDTTYLSIQLVQIYGFLSLYLLLFLLTPGPLFRLVPSLPGARRVGPLMSPLGISCFYFALLHSAIGFFVLYQGFPGWRFLPFADQLSTVLAFGALFILAAMAGTSFDYFQRVLGSRWKTIHRFVYFAAIFTAAHVVIVGSHFAEMNDPVSFLAFIWFIALVVMHATAFSKLLMNRYPHMPPWIFSAALLAVMLLLFYVLYLLHTTYGHANH